jgi:putative ABC transport system permease protein
MTFAGLVWCNLRARPFRAVLTAAAVSIGVVSVVALGILTYSLRETAVSILRTGDADFSIAEKHVDDLLNSNIAESDLREVQRIDGVESAVGVLVDTERFDDDHPLVIEIGIRRADQAPFGVRVLAGHSYDDSADDQVMIGYRLADDLGKEVGDQLQVGSERYRITGLFRTGVAIGDSAVMYPLAHLQAEERLAGNVSLVFVKTRPGASIGGVRHRIEAALPQLTTIRDSTDYGRADRNLVLIGAANIGGSILAIVIGASGVMNTSLMSYFERIREFGVLRSIGWGRWRVLVLVLGEALVLSLIGAAVGVGLGVGVVELLARFGSLRGVLDPLYTSTVFARALGFAVGMAFIGAAYPAWRSARLEPLEALRRE